MLERYVESVASLTVLIRLLPNGEAWQSPKYLRIPGCASRFRITWSAPGNAFNDDWAGDRFIGLRGCTGPSQDRAAKPAAGVSGKIGSRTKETSDWLLPQFRTSVGSF